MCRLWQVPAKPIGKFGESQPRMEEEVFGKCEYLLELGKTVEYSHLLNL
jgi:hypothetical protein